MVWFTHAVGVQCPAMGNGLFLAAVQLEILSSAQLLPMGNFGQLPKYAVTSDFILVQDPLSPMRGRGYRPMPRSDLSEGLLNLSMNCVQIAISTALFSLL